MNEIITACRGAEHLSTCIILPTQTSNIANLISGLIYTILFLYFHSTVPLVSCLQAAIFHLWQLPHLDKYAV